jgi:rhodanese-related sulfurtransferase
MNAVPEIGVAELPACAVLLDVREYGEWAAGHAPDATHMPMNEVPGRLAEVPDGDPVYVICRVGVRSARVVGFLNQQRRAAVNVGGGMRAWAAAGRPMVSERAGAAPGVI